MAGRSNRVRLAVQAQKMAERQRKEQLRASSQAARAAVQAHKEFARAQRAEQAERERLLKVAQETRAAQLNEELSETVNQLERLFVDTIFRSNALLTSRA